jgi:hypothetical protein
MKLRKRMAQHSAQTRCGRVDLQMIDYELLGPQEAEILIQYTRGAGVPRIAQVAEWVASFPGGCRLVNETVTNYPEHNVLRATLNKASLSMPYDKKYTTAMMKVGSNQFMDTHEAIWEVKAGDNGDKFLLRVSEEDLDGILSERLSRLQHGSTQHLPKLAHLVTAGISNPEVGDQIEYYDEVLGRRFGKVTKVTADDVMISADGESAEVARGDIIAVSRKSPKAVQERRAEEKDFYSRAYGDAGFAKKLVR